MSNLSGNWSYSRDGELFHGSYDTWHEAVLDILSHQTDDSASVLVGQCEPPPAPENFDLGGALPAYQPATDFRAEMTGQLNRYTGMPRTGQSDAGVTCACR